MKYVILAIMLVSIAYAENIKAIVIKNDSVATETTITSNTDNLMASVNSEMIECTDGEFIVIKQYILTGVWIEKNDILYVYPVNNPNNLMLGTAFAGGIVVGLYCPLTPRHIINYQCKK